MRGVYVNDLSWSTFGDLVIGKRGDLEDTGAGNTNSFVQEVQTRIKSDLGDWAMHQELGSSLSLLVGEPNNRKTAEEGRIRIMSALTKDSFCDASRIKIRYMPLGIHTIMYDVKITLPGAPDGEPIEVTALFDSNERNVTFA